MKRVYLDNFCQFLWRPRPPTLLSVEKQKEIKKSLKKYSSQFESKDRMRLTKASKELIEKRQKMMHEFEEHRKKRLQQWEQLKTRRLELRNSTYFNNVLFYYIFYMKNTSPFKFLRMIFTILVFAMIVYDYVFVPFFSNKVDKVII